MKVLFHYDIIEKGVDKLNGMWKKKNSLKFKIIVLPIILMLFAIVFISIGSILTSREALMKQMKMDGIQLAEQVSSEIENAYYALEAVNGFTDDKILKMGDYIGKNQPRMSNQFLVELATDMGVDEINVTDANGLVLYSNLESSIGAVFGADHISYSVLSSKQANLIEQIRKSRETGNFYKYGYVKLPDGGMVQIGLLANKIEEMKRNIDENNLMDKIASKEHIRYAMVTDEHGIITVASIEEKVGTKVQGENIDQVIANRENTAILYEQNGETTYDMFVPLQIDGKHEGYVLIGLKMDNVQSAIAKNIWIASMIGLAAFAVSCAVLYIISKKILMLIGRLVDVSKHVANGELNHDISLTSQDETGILASNFKNMMTSLKDTIRTMQSQSMKTEEISEQLNSVVKEISESTQNIADTIQELSSGNNSQADNLASISETMRVFSERIEAIVEAIVDMNKSAGHVDSNVKESQGNIEKVIVSFENTNQAFGKLIEKISAVGTNVNKINEITELINDIAEQTNLLALNASIEAARAGETGRGFAVVADEIRKLAEQTRSSSEDIGNLISNISLDTRDMISTTDVMKDEINTQRNDINDAKTSFGHIIVDMENIIPKMDSINENANQIDSQRGDIIDSIEKISDVAKEISLMSEEIASSSQQVSAVTMHVGGTADTLSEMTGDMKNTVDKFKI